MRLELAVNLSTLTFPACAGRRTVYANVTIGKRTFWAMRWDTARCERPKYRPFALSSDGLMCWTMGVRHG